MSVAITFDLSVIPEKVPAFLDFLTETGPETRSFDGCDLFDIYVDQDTPGRVLFYEIWESREKQEKYLEWRTERGDMESFGAFLAGAPAINYYDKFES